MSFAGDDHIFCFRDIDRQMFRGEIGGNKINVKLSNVKTSKRSEGTGEKNVVSIAIWEEGKQVHRGDGQDQE